MDEDEEKQIRNADFMIAGSWGDLLIVVVLVLIGGLLWEKYGEPRLAQLEGRFND